MNKIKRSADQIREMYNRNYSQPVNRWSPTNLNDTQRRMKWMLKKCHKLGVTSIPSVLDVGCGTGYCVQALHLQGCPVVGIDYSDVAIKLAQDKFKDCKFVHMDAYEPDFEPQSFDLILCRGFTETDTHDLSVISAFINKYMGYLRERGVFVLSHWSNFSGIEKEGETMVNHTHEEILQIPRLIDDCQRAKLWGFYWFGWLSRIKEILLPVLGLPPKRSSWYLFIQKK